MKRCGYCGQFFEGGHECRVTGGGTSAVVGAASSGSRTKLIGGGSPTKARSGSTVRAVTKTKGGSSFDRAAYHRTYMKKYMREYMKKRRARLRAEGKL